VDDAAHKGKSVSRGSWAYSVVVWLVMVLYVAPLLIAWNLWDTLDELPYLVCLLVGGVLSAVGWQVAKWRAGHAPLGMWRLGAIGWAPCVAVAAGLGGNALLDSSPAVAHEVLFLGYHSGQKGPTRAHFASWRTPGDKEKVACNFWRQSEICLPLKSGDKVVVTTHAGALGWEWIEGVKAR
jgi:hypothetical protein